MADLRSQSMLDCLVQHGIKAAGRRAKACPSQRAGFLAGLGAGRLGFMGLAGIKGPSHAVKTPPHGQALARLTRLFDAGAVDTRRERVSRFSPFVFGNINTVDKLSDFQGAASCYS